MTTKVRKCVATMRFGIGIVVIALAFGIAVNVLFGPVYGEFGWRVVAAVGMVSGIMAITGVWNFFRPKNPYWRLDPRFSYLDTVPTGEMTDGGSGWIWNMFPPAIGIALLLVSLAVW